MHWMDTEFTRTVRTLHYKRMYSIWTKLVFSRNNKWQSESCFKFVLVVIKKKKLLTLEMGLNVRGTSKILLLIIGKYRNHRCLTNIKSLPVQYDIDKKAWLNSNLLGDYITKLNSISYNYVL